MIGLSLQRCGVESDHFLPLSLQVDSSHRIEVPAYRLTPEQAEQLQAHASAHGDSRHHIAMVEKVRRQELALVEEVGGRGCFPPPPSSLPLPRSSWRAASRSRRRTRTRLSTRASDVIAGVDGRRCRRRHKLNLYWLRGTHGRWMQQWHAMAVLGRMRE